MAMQGNLLDLLRSATSRSPDAIALEWRGPAWVYRDLLAAVSGTASRLRRDGLVPGQRVALFFRNCPQYVALYYGTLAAGCIVVPLNFQDKATVLANQLRHCGASVLLGDPGQPEWRALASDAADAGVRVAEVPVKDLMGAAAFISWLSRESAPEVGVSLAGQESDPATIIYTSGTTGRPKGVVLSHGNLASNMLSVISYLGMTSTDVGLCVLPFHFSYGNSVLHTHLAVGARLMLEDNFAFPAAVLRKMQDNKVTGFSGVPSTFALMLARCRLADFDLSHLRYLTQAGGPMPPSTTARLRRELPWVDLFVMYGQTEATARLTYLHPRLVDRKLGSVGVGIPGVEVAVQRDDGTPSAPGEIGEICARGPNIMLGYWRDPELTAKVVRDGWLHTGDLGHMDPDGLLYVDGRSADMIKVGAFRVSPQEIEEVIAELDAVVEVGVASMPDPLLGQVPRAVIVPRAGVALTEREVRAHCLQRLAAYKVPKTVEFAEVLPRTSSGKVQRHKLVIQEVTASHEHQ